MGKLMVIDGLDGCGKSTQLDLLDAYLKEGGKAYRQISFPDYDQPSSALVKMYLGGELGGSADAVNAYAASSFYAVDRYASFTRFWREDYENGTPIVAARYVTSNAIHQMTKLPESAWDSFLEWLEDYEYNKLCLPRPDAVVFLDMPIEVSQRLMEKRYGGDEDKKDIHERDLNYLYQCRKAALYAGRKKGWQIIACSQNVVPLPREVIHQQLVQAFEDMIHA
ncbi:MAG: deoxynucleoside kinase [Clostridia bacterium]|nr:deoxynucleoside kinase [Clostridia bacterium]